MNGEPMHIDDCKAMADIRLVDVDEQPYDVAYFKRELEKEASNLWKLCEAWEKNLTVSDDFSSFNVTNEKSILECIDATKRKEVKEGEIRLMIGKAKIILGDKGRFKQFQDLIRNCEFGIGEKKTNCTDLQGFWEMISFQVDEIKSGFCELSKLEEMGWNKTEIFESASKSRKEKQSNKNQGIDRKISVPNIEKKPSIPTNRKPSSGIREMMAAKRKEMALSKKQTSSPGKNDGSIAQKCTLFEATMTSSIGINVEPVQENDIKEIDEEKLFDGGFFNISSPTHNSRRLHCITPQSSNIGNMETESLSAPSSTTSTPVRSITKSLRRSLLVDTAAKKLASDVGAKSVSSLALVRVNSAIRRSISQNDTPRLEPVFKKLRTRTILEQSKTSETK